MNNFDRSTLIGVVFDLSIAHGSDGVRKIDKIKQILLNNVLNTNLFTKIYVAHHEWLKIPKDQGESTYYLISYNEPISFSIEYAFKQAVTMVGECREDCDKYVFLFTDRFSAAKSFQYRKAFLVNDVRGYAIKFCVFGTGTNYDDKMLKSMSEEYNAFFKDLNEPNELTEVLSQILVKK